jgi:hypothetical protein
VADVGLRPAQGEGAGLLRAARDVDRHQEIDSLAGSNGADGNKGGTQKRCAGEREQECGLEGHDGHLLAHWAIRLGGSPSHLLAVTL